MYKGKIYKTTNMLGKTLSQYCHTDSAMIKEQKRIEGELAAFEKTSGRPGTQGLARQHCQGRSEGEGQEGEEEPPLVYNGEEEPFVEQELFRLIIGSTRYGAQTETLI